MSRKFLYTTSSVRMLQPEAAQFTNEIAELRAQAGGEALVPGDTEDEDDRTAQFLAKHPLQRVIEKSGVDPDISPATAVARQGPRAWPGAKDQSVDPFAGGFAAVLEYC